MSFSLSYWFLFPLLAIGAWLAYRLYFDSALLSRRWRWTLGALTVLAWLTLAGLLIQPLWTRTVSVYHAPAIVIAVDESPSYSAGATLHSAETLRTSVEEVRKYYQEKGFKVLDFAFGETVVPFNLKDSAELERSVKEKIGTLTSLEALRHAIDSLAIPNLQGVFLWTDGRLNKDVEAQTPWSASVFPMVLQSGRSSEVQGENVTMDFSNPDSGVEVNAEWRVLGKSGHGAMLEIRSGSQVLWKEPLSDLDSSFGSKLRHRFRISANLLRGNFLQEKADHWTALVRPDRKTDDEFEQNDTVDLQILGLHRKRQIFPRPLRSLEERGLVDALFASDSIEVQVVPPESLEADLRTGDVLWAHTRTAQVVSAVKKSGTPLVVYTIPGEAVSSKTFSFTSSARVTWSDDAGKFFPGEVLSLSDLGISHVDLPALEDQSETLIAWVEEGSHRGVVLSRDKNESSPQFQFIAPPMWSSGFHPGADDRIRRLQQQWVQGAAEYIRQQSVRVQTPAPKVARDPMNLEMSRLGVDEEKLSDLAMRTHGSLLHTSDDEKTFVATLPDLPRGQSEDTRTQAHPLFPFVSASWIVAGLLCTAWALRKKRHLD